MTVKINTKITTEFTRTSSTPPDFTKRNKELVRTIPVSESKREACRAIQQGLMNQIQERLNAEKKVSDERNKRNEQAAEPFRKLKAKLSNPRIKRRGKAGSAL